LKVDDAQSRYHLAVNFFDILASSEVDDSPYRRADDPSPTAYSHDDSVAERHARKASTELRLTEAQFETIVACVWRAFIFSQPLC
jgi:hypothetical protein